MNKCTLMYSCIVTLGMSTKRVTVQIIPGCSNANIRCPCFLLAPTHTHTHTHTHTASTADLGKVRPKGNLRPVGCPCAARGGQLEISTHTYRPVFIMRLFRMFQKVPLI